MYENICKKEEFNCFRYNELFLDFNIFYTKPYINTSLPTIKREAANLYTQNVYDLVKKKILNVGGVNVINRCQVGDKVTFKVDKFSIVRDLVNILLSMTKLNPNFSVTV